MFGQEVRLPSYQGSDRLGFQGGKSNEAPRLQANLARVKTRGMETGQGSAWFHLDPAKIARRWTNPFLLVVACAIAKGSVMEGARVEVTDGHGVRAERACL